MADKKISALTAASTPLAGTEVLPIVQSGATVKVAVSDLTAGRAVSMLSATAGNVQVSGNTIVTTDTNGNLTVTPNGSGKIVQSQPNQTPTYQFRTNGDVGGANQGQLEWYQTAAGTNAVIASVRAKRGGGAFNQASLILSTADAGANTDRVELTADGNIVPLVAAKGVNFTANTPAAGMTSQLLNWYEEGTWTPNQGAGLVLVGAFSSSGTYTRIGRQVMVRGQVVGATSVAVNAAGVISSNLPFSAGVTHAGSMFDNAVTASGVVQITSASVVAATTIAATPNITFSATYTV